MTRSIINCWHKAPLLCLEYIFGHNNRKKYPWWYSGHGDNKGKITMRTFPGDVTVCIVPRRGHGEPGQVNFERDRQSSSSSSSVDLGNQDLFRKYCRYKEKSEDDDPFLLIRWTFMERKELLPPPLLQCDDVSLFVLARGAMKLPPSFLAEDMDTEYYLLGLNGK